MGAESRPGPGEQFHFRWEQKNSCENQFDFIATACKS